MPVLIFENQPYEKEMRTTWSKAFQITIYGSHGAICDYQIIEVRRSVHRLCAMTPVMPIANFVPSAYPLYRGFRCLRIADRNIRQYENNTWIMAKKKINHYRINQNLSLEIGSFTKIDKPENPYDRVFRDNIRFLYYRIHNIVSSNFSYAHFNPTY